MKKIFACLYLTIMAGSVCAQRAADNLCTICERVNSFDQLVARTAESFWPGFSDPAYRAPLFYFTPRYTYMFFASPRLLKNFETEKKECSSGLKFYRSAKI